MRARTFSPASVRLALRTAAAGLATVIAVACLGASHDARAARVTPGGHTPARGVLAPVPPGDLGYPITCVDARAGTRFQYHAQHVFSAGAVDSAWVADSTHICLGSQEGGAQLIIGDAVGGAYVAWVDDHGLEPDIAIQRVTAQGAVAEGWPNDGVAVCGAANAQYQLDACGDHNGGAYLVWQDFRRGIPSVYLQRVTESGGAASGWPAEGLAVSSQVSEQTMPRATGDGSAGGAFVVWLDRRGGSLAIYGQRVTAAGTVAGGWPTEGASIVLPGPHEHLTTTRVVGDAVGHMFLVWRVEDDSLGSSLQCAWMNSSSPPSVGSPLIPIVLASGARRIGEPSISLANDGSVLIVWADWRSDVQTLLAMRVSADGTIVSGFPAAGRVVASGSIGINAPAILGDGLGGAIVAWENHQKSDGGDIYAQHLLADGTLAPNWPVDGLSLCTARGDQSAPSLSPDGNGGAIATWIDAGTAAGAGYLSLHRTGGLQEPKLISTLLDPGHVRLTWQVDGLLGDTYHAYRRQGEQDWQFLADLTPDDSSRVLLDDPSAPEQVVEYRLGVDHAGVFTPFAPVQVVVPAAPLVLALTRVWAGSAEGGIWMEFALPRGPEASADVIDIAGRRILSQSLASFTPGIHKLLLRPSGRFPAGVYFVRLMQGPQTRAHKVVFVH